ncbi:sensor histidine kinase [Paenibacillus montanisoli]|uniref:Sensor histidine kinase n=1 Tax=Paenibacillus montanisoli TaxID=2081970 RepID=A0A328U1R5_9BACL|nr:histidine kinase [Paenibacillus montanisoli]RAP76727.1 sensor histidine kinase [Paenibacillus montanisoli]
MRASLRTKLIIGFLSVTVPLFALLLYNNFYAMDVVREEVGQSNKNLLSMYRNEIDRTLVDAETYLYNFVVLNENLPRYGKSEPGSADYFFAKVRVQNKMTQDLVNYPNVNLIYAYGRAENELLSTAFRGGDEAKLESVTQVLKSYIASHSDKELREKTWRIIRQGGELAIVRLVPTEYGQVVGAWTELDKLMVPLSYVSLGKQGQALFIASDGTPLTKAGIQETDSPGGKLPLPAENERYIRLRASGQNDYLLVATASRYAPLHLAVLVPESTLLQQLPYFQRLFYIIPLIGLAVLAVYLLLLQRTLLKPMYELIKGMRQIKRGDLETRLMAGGSKEFIIINDTFNDMASQVHDLKIDVYEEHIRTQKAELKHLQVQINPHFLLNAINIVYNLAELNKTDLIKKMATHISKYFRFVTRTNLSSVSVNTEFEHLQSYLEIQQLRFPQYLRYELTIAPGLERETLPPLIVQPFVENAIVHGFEMGPEFFMIKVAAKPAAAEDAPYYEIAIADNGVGIAEDQLQELQREDIHADFEDGHLGIWNVRHRLKLQYGGAAELLFERGQPKGTVVTLRLPYSSPPMKPEKGGG